MELNREKLAKYIPDEMSKYIDIFYSDEELLLVQLLIDEPLSEKEIEEKLGKSPKDLILRAYKRAMVDKVPGDDGVLRYKPTSVSIVINNTATFDRDIWESIPEDDRKIIADWRYKDNLDRARTMTSEEWAETHVQKILPLKQIKEYLKSKGTEFRVIPCDCHSGWGDAGYDKHVCICTDTGINTQFDRGNGEVKTLEETLEVLDRADALGLVHTQEHLHICNCNRKYCYPMRESFDLGLEGKWPTVSYVVTFSKAKCLKCKVCMKRCQFGVFSFENGEIKLDRKKCWGCGVCVSKCPGKALKVRKKSECTKKEA